MSISIVGAQDTNTELLYSSLCLVKETCTMMNITIVCVYVFTDPYPLLPTPQIQKTLKTKNSSLSCQQNMA